MVDKKVIQLDDRIPKLKARRRQKANRRLIIYATVFFLLIAVLIYLVSPISNVHTIAVKGNHHIKTGQIEKAGQITNKSKIWDVDEARSAARIEKSLPMVKTASVSSHFPSKVEIKVVEYRRVAYLKTGDDYIPILENGTKLDQEKEHILPTDAPVIIGFSNSDLLQKLAAQLTKTTPAMVHAISEIMPANEEKHSDYITLYMNGGQQVLADVDTLAKKIELYPGIMAILTKDKKGRGIIDLTLGASWTPYTKVNKEAVPSGKK
ncbi:MAG: cell division protein FtsQ/DivIB [Tuberibacillus sp.]